MRNEYNTVCINKLLIGINKSINGCAGLARASGAAEDEQRVHVEGAGGDTHAAREARRRHCGRTREDCLAREVPEHTARVPHD